RSSRRTVSGSPALLLPRDPDPRGPEAHPPVNAGSDLSMPRLTSRSDPTTTRPGAGGTGRTPGTATVTQPAASAAATPFGESSSTTQRAGSAPSRAAAVR